MSSVGKTHWCYQCSRAIRPQAHDLICPHCDGGFVQELPELMGPQPLDPPSLGITGPFYDPRFGVMNAFAALTRHRMVGGRDPNFDGQARPSAIQDRPVHAGSRQLLIVNGQHYPFGLPDHDPFDFFFNSGPSFGQRSHGDLSDFLTGHDLHELIEQLSMNDRQQRGPPPAPRSAIDAMPTVKITQRHLNTETHCPVCQDKFDLGSKARQMPCDHLYHSECIMRWLAEHNSCPVCRVELPSGGSVNARSNLNRRSSNSSGNNGAGSSRRDQTRWNPFSFLWPSSSTN